jgi:hypothetical protein
MSMEHCSIAALFDIPQPNHFIDAATDQDMTVWTPGYAIDPLCIF